LIAGKLRFRNPIRSVGGKLFVLIVSSILFCVLLLGLFSYDKSSVVIKSKVADASAQTAEQTAGKLNLLFAGYERQSLQLVTDSDFMEMMRTLSLATTDAEELNSTVGRLTEKLGRVMRADSTLASVSLIPVNAEDPLMTTSGSLVQSGMVQASITDAIKQGNGRVAWIPTLVNGIDGKGEQPTFAFGRLLNQGKPYMLLFEITVDSLENQLKNVKFGERSAVYVVAPDGTIVYNPNAEQMGAKYEYRIPEGSETVPIQGEQMLSSVGTIEINEWKLIGNVPLSELVKDAGQIRQLTLLLSGIAILIAAGIGLIVMRTIGAPIVQLRKLMNEGEKGDLTVRSTIRNNDEIGQLGDSFNRMMEGMSRLVCQANQFAADVLATASSLSEASRKTAGAASEIATATEEIAHGASNLAEESERGNELTSRIGEQIRNFIATNDQMGQAAKEVDEASCKGSDGMVTLNLSTAETEEMIRSMEVNVGELRECTSSITGILDVLENISRRTNILALNAGIEAVRAEGGGKGFMVIAEEIRSLADQSRKSIESVGSIVATIQGEIEETVSVLQRAYPVFRKQIESIRETNEIFLDVRQNMNGFLESLAAATQSVHHLEEAQISLSASMSNVSAVAQQASATSEEVATLCQETLAISEGLVQLSNRLQSVSTQLHESMSQFKVS